MLSQERSKRKSSGGRYKKFRKKKKRFMARLPSLTKLGERSLRKIRVMGGNIKQRLLADNKINVYVPKEKKVKAVKILSVVENPSNREFTRKNIITKGAIVNTELGKVKVTSRPGQDGLLNGVLLEN